ncbi:MAG TPA: ATP-dependent DNA helicase, partial [Patescibacteria group bacterium]|nr:ATP-dependent DNA helicase [Patescibacteria group bacterium]
VTEKIEELIVKQSLQYKDIAILVRANEHAQPFMRAFQRANIPFQFLGPGRLFHQEEIKDLIAYLKSLYNFEDNTSVYRVLTMSIFQLNTRDIAAIMNFAKKTNTSLFETLEKVDAVSISDESKEKVKEFVEMMHRHLKRVPRETAGQILYYFLEDSGLLKVFLQTKSAQEEKQALNIAKFFEKLKTYEATHDDASLFAVVDWIDLSMQLGESPLATDSDWSENNAVNILTVHSSKGLEFPAVFITNLVTQRFPTRDRKEQIPVPEDLIKETLPEGDYNLQEERRLFYVAMTRARDFLFLTASHYYGEGKRERKLSPFVIETLDEEAIEKHLKKHRDETSAEQLSLIDILQDAKKVAIQIEEAQKTEPHLVTYLSYSQINTFDTCPLHYKLKYILKIPSQPSPALSFGSSIHAVLRDYFQMDIREKREASKILEELLDKNWLNEGYSSKTHERQAFTHAKEVIKKFVVKNKGVIPLATEIPFLFSIDGLKIGGRIDRIDQAADGMIEIIDYKTGMNHPDARKLAADLQLTLYALAAKNVKDSLLDKSPEQILLSLLYVEDNLKFTTTRDAKQLEELKDFLLQKAKEISASDFACSITNCKNCEYKILCQAYG